MNQIELRCHECGNTCAVAPINVCDLCFATLDVAFDVTQFNATTVKNNISSGPPSIWRYKDLLPLDGEPILGQLAGWTPLVRAERLGKALGLNNLHLKNDDANHPTLSFKDRAVAVAMNKALEFGLTTVACASTGNLANSVAAHAAQGGIPAYVLVPADTDPARIAGTLVYGAKLIAVSGSYDEVNRLCAKAAVEYGWAFVNINLRPFYGEGAKTLGYEIAEQLGWRSPDHIISPCGGGSLLSRTYKGLTELADIGIIDKPTTKMHAAQAKGCSPIATAVISGSEVMRPVLPHTIARSVAIGNPVDGYRAIATVRESGGWAAAIDDEEIINHIKLLARTEGIFTEPAGGMAIAACAQLRHEGLIGSNDEVVVVLPGHGVKTTEVLKSEFGRPVYIQPTLNSLNAALKVERQASGRG